MSRGWKGLALAAGALAVIGSADMPATAQAPSTPIVLRISATSEDDVTPILYAQRTGLFEKSGLTVRLQKQANGAAIAEGVLSGVYDIGKAAVLPLMNAHLKGLPLVIIAPAGLYDDRAPFAQLVVAATSPYRSAKDLNGKTLSGAAIHDIGQLASSAWVDAHGGDSTTLHFIELPQSAAGAALAEHRIDGTTLLGAQLQNALDAGGVRALGPSFGAIAPHFLFSAWFVSAEFAAQHPEVVAGFARVVSEAADYTNTHHAQTAPLIADFTDIPLATIGRMTRAVCGDVVRPADIQPVIDMALRYHFIDHAFPASELIAPAFTK